MKRITQVLTLAALFAAPSLAVAQDDGQPERPREPVRDPVVDLEKQAEERRPGQVMPGDEASEPYQPATEQPPETGDPGDGQPVPPDPVDNGGEPLIQTEPPPAPSWVVVPSAVTAASVEGPERLVQWRSAGPDDARGVWSPPAAGAAHESGAEVRTGLGASLTVQAGGWQITLDRLTKAAVLAAEHREDGTRRIEVRLDRGLVTVSGNPGTSTTLVVITPDQAVPIEGGITGVTHDAFRGTRTR